MSEGKADTKGKWADLGPRVISAVVLVAVGAFEIQFGGHGFHVLVAVICGAMAWELLRMASPEQRNLAFWLALAVSFAVMATAYLPRGLSLPLLFLPVMAGIALLARRRTIWVFYAPVILLAGLSLMILRDTFGARWMLWLVLIVVASDVLGYFAGRLIGGPKFWPSISPKKTWSGTIAGWIGAALVGLAFMGADGAGIGIVGVSIMLAMAAQMGDIAESAIKRKLGVKDSSHLIPGHGGVMDRFDGMVGAAVLLLVAGPVAGVPPGLS
jgi:phosphatidate cytidylyltransferase